MLPQLTKTHALVAEMASEALFDAMYEAGPLLLNIGTYHQKEGQDGSYQRSSGEIEKVDFQKTAVEMSSRAKPGRGETLRDLLAIYTEGGAKMGVKMQSDLIAEVEAATQKVGNVVSIKNGVFTPEAFMEMIEKVEIDFDEEGKSQSSWVLPPDTAADFQEKMKAWQQDPKLMAKLAELERKKKDEFRAREASRRLAR